MSLKDRKAGGALKQAYAPTDAGEKAPTAFRAGSWGLPSSAIGQSWRRAWSEVIPFFAFPDEISMIVKTTNAIEALKSKARRPRHRALPLRPGGQLLYLILNRSEQERKVAPRERPWQAPSSTADLPAQEIVAQKRSSTAHVECAAI